jgi:hypothetical protein
LPTASTVVARRSVEESSGTETVIPAPVKSATVPVWSGVPVQVALFL